MRVRVVGRSVKAEECGPPFKDYDEEEIGRLNQMKE